MRDARRQTDALSKEEAVRQCTQLAREFTSLGLTKAPNRQSVTYKRYGDGWAVYTGYQDSD
jgi:hypothetical protein